MNLSLLAVSALAVSAPILSAPAFGAATPVEGVSIIKDMPEAAFAPPGFDSNDHSQVVLSGTFTNTCFKAGPAHAEVNPLTQTVEITQKAYYLDSSWCLQMLVPYTTVVDVGILPPGSYDVKLIGEQKRQKVMENLSISAAGDSAIGPDEALYALAEEVSLSNDILTIKGKIPGACTTLKEVKVLARKKNIIEVLPLLDTANMTAPCSEKFVEFEKEIAFKSPWQGRTLIHVRSLNGRALNKVVELN